MKPRDIAGNDLIVPSTLVAMEVARAAGLENDLDFVRKLAFGLHSKELERIKNEQNSVS